MERRARAELRDRLAEETADSTVRALYEEHEHELMWVSADGLNRHGERVLEAIASAAADGLDPDAYGAVEARDALQAVSQEELPTDDRAEALADAELALTLGFADLLRDLAMGGSEPADVLPAWRIAQADTAAGTLLARLGSGDEPLELMAQARPLTEQYAALQEVRTRLRDVDSAGGWPEVPDRRIRTGSDDEAVAALRARLLLSVVEEEREAAAAGQESPAVFDEGLERALRSFQARHRLEADGELDTGTVQALNVAAADRLRTVELNLERWRWMPRELGKRAVLVNVAGYDIRLLEDGETVLHMKAVVGKPAWRTPLFSDTMTHMIVHPYWNVPESILAEELIPSVREDRSYFVANNYEVVDAQGELVLGDVEIDDLDPEAEGGLRVRQRPGAGNALGQVKFMFPNNENVYLHDTPAKAFFERDARALSHGCVRVERPLELARFLTKWTNGNPAEFEKALAEEETARIDLPHAVPVYLAYFTVWMDDAGAPHFLADPYGHDDEMSDLILSTESSRLASARTRPVRGGD